MVLFVIWLFVLYDIWYDVLNIICCFWYNIIGIVKIEIFILINFSDCIYWVNLSKVGLFKNSIGKIMIMVWILNEFRFKVNIIFEVSFMLGI